MKDGKVQVRATIVIYFLALLFFYPVSGMVAQEMVSSVRSTALTIHTFDGKDLTVSPEDLAALPHRSVTVMNPHSNKSETYSGVPLADLLGKVGIPLGEKLKGKLFMTGVIAGGADNYQVLFSLAEIDPAVHTGDVIVADTVDGKKLDKDGAFKMVSSQDKRPARWVRNLTTISVIEVKP